MLENNLNEMWDFCAKAQSCLCGWNPFIFTIQEMREKVFEWDDKLDEMEQTDDVVVARAHLLYDVIEMGGRGISSYDEGEDDFERQEMYENRWEHRFERAGDIFDRAREIMAERREAA